MKQPVERRLAAILAADVAGYSRLMGADEEGTLDRLKALRRELLDPKIAEHRGRIVKTTGDGLLEGDGPPVSTPHRFSAADWADSGPDFISKAFRSSICNLGISVSFILARMLVISSDL